MRTDHRSIRGPASITYTLSNSGGSSLDWTASKSKGWVSWSSISGTLAAGASTTLTVSINAYSESMEAGSYSDTISFLDGTTGNGNTSRSVSLVIRQGPRPCQVRGPKARFQDRGGFL